MVLGCSKQHDKAPKSPVTLNRVQIYRAWTQLECHGAPLVRPSSARQRRLFLPGGDCTFTFFPCYEKLILVNKTCPNIGLLITNYQNIKEKMVPIFFICPILLDKFNLHTNHLVSVFQDRCFLPYLWRSARLNVTRVAQWRGK